MEPDGPHRGEPARDKTTIFGMITWFFDKVIAPPGWGPTLKVITLLVVIAALWWLLHLPVPDVSTLFQPRL